MEPLFDLVENQPGRVLDSFWDDLMTYMFLKSLCRSLLLKRLLTHILNILIRIRKRLLYKKETHSPRMPWFVYDTEGHCNVSMEKSPTIANKEREILEHNYRYQETRAFVEQRKKSTPPEETSWGSYAHTNNWVMNIENRECTKNKEISPTKSNKDIFINNKSEGIYRILKFW